MAGFEKTDVHIVWRATPAIQCARRFFHPYLKETKKNQQSVLEYNFMTKNMQVSKLGSLPGGGVNYHQHQ